jgi:cytochrome c oxidase subunit 2
VSLKLESRRGRSSPQVLRIGVVVAFAALFVLAACAPNAPQDTLKPEGQIGREINQLWWPVFWIATAVFFIVEGALLFLLFKYREKRGQQAPEQVHGNTRLEVAWTIAPTLILTFVAVFTVAGIFRVAAKPTGDFLTVKVTAHQWWWEYEYPDEKVITANELHIPTGKTVYLELHSADVIHSFWVPKLAGKQDVVPGRNNSLKIEADEPGTYPGQCVEFCGLSHANMRLLVIAHDPADFDDWVTEQKAVAANPTDPLAARGRQLFLEGKCVTCHAIAGTQAVARQAPDLTHFASREMFAGAIFQNNTENLKRWLRDPPAMKPMAPDRAINPVGMPDYGLSEDDINALVAYLETLT